MIPKYIPLLKTVFSYISNRLEVEVAREILASEIVNKFPTYVLFHDINKEMQLAVAETLILQAEYYKKRDLI